MYHRLLYCPTLECHFAVPGNDYNKIFWIMMPWTIYDKGEPLPQTDQQLLPTGKYRLAIDKDRTQDSIIYVPLYPEDQGIPFCMQSYTEMTEFFHELYDMGKILQ